MWLRLRKNKIVNLSNGIYITIDEIRIPEPYTWHIRVKRLGYKECIELYKTNNGKKAMNIFSNLCYRIMRGKK